MIGIIGAMEIEIEGIRSLMTEKEEKTVSGVKYVIGKLGNNNIVTAVCGIGKVFAAICAQTMILNFKPDIIVNTGVAGSIDASLGILDIAVADKVVQHDMDTSPIGDPKGLLSGINVIYMDADEKASALLVELVKEAGINAVRGAIASGDQFIASKTQKDEIKANFPDAIACEMEGAAIGQVCYVNKVRFAVLRAISDNADGGAVEDYPAFAKKTAENYIGIVARFAQDYSL
ncbi:MAG: 5'-methylthioadenosine/adenosylhomocysteine nucleosidase [Clostridia bacterium]|nr:5'-methylthioadenosine/adenosylhomocysteine nucleosidase [Clostridia bacterium]